MNKQLNDNLSATAIIHPVIISLLGAFKVIINGVAVAIAAALGFTLHGAARPAAQVTTYLADKAALLILDSFEHLTAGAAWLTALLAAAPCLRILTTTLEDSVNGHLVGFCADQALEEGRVVEIGSAVGKSARVS